MLDMGSSFLKGTDYHVTFSEDSTVTAKLRSHHTLSPWHSQHSKNVQGIPNCWALKGLPSN
jgi:hypothetical protein